MICSCITSLTREKFSTLATKLSHTAENTEYFVSVVYFKPAIEFVIDFESELIEVKWQKSRQQRKITFFVSRQIYTHSFTKKNNEFIMTLAFQSSH